MVATTDATTRQAAAIRRLIVSMVTSQRAPDVYYNVRTPFWFTPQSWIALPSRVRLHAAPWLSTMTKINLVVTDNEFRYRLADQRG